MHIHQQFNNGETSESFQKWYLAVGFSSTIGLMIELRGDLSSLPLLPLLALAGVHISGLQLLSLPFLSVFKKPHLVSGIICTIEL